MAQLTSEPIVMDRYMRHFTMGRNEVIAFFRILSLSRLKEDGVYPVYNVPSESGEIRRRLFRLRRGTLVWVDLKGDPILKESCGNPMTLGPKRSEATKTPTETGDMQGLAEMELGELEPEIAEEWIGPVNPHAPGLDAYFGDAAFEGAGPAPTGLPTLISGDVGGSDWRWLAGLLLIVGIGAELSTSGPPSPPVEPPPIPEPATLIGLGIGLAWLSRARRPRST